jgi:hypothetical protein
MDLFAVEVSKNLHRTSLVNVFHAPMSFFGMFTESTFPLIIDQSFI